MLVYHTAGVVVPRWTFDGANVEADKITDIRYGVLHFESGARFDAPVDLDYSVVGQMAVINGDDLRVVPYGEFMATAVRAPHAVDILVPLAINPADAPVAEKPAE